jgi:hypothetical protein
MNITIPKKLEPIVKAFFAESPQAAKALILQAVKAIYGIDENEYNFRPIGQYQVTPEDLKTVCSIMTELKPTDMIEAIFAAQIVASHMLGMEKLTSTTPQDLHLGLKVIKFSNNALLQLQRKRSGGIQNITVNYNYSGKAQKPTYIPLEEVDYAD